MRWVVALIIILAMTTLTPPPPIIEKEIVFVQDNRALDLLSEIMGQDCSDILIFETYVTATAYTARKEECDAHPEVTANMTPSRVGLVAVSRDLDFLLNEYIIIPGMGLFLVADVMNRRFKHCIDILHANVKAADLFGVKKGVKIIWLRNRKQTSQQQLEESLAE